jgi:diguanylate cyclase (GGDEF)-like protein
MGLAVGLGMSDQGLLSPYVIVAAALVVGIVVSPLFNWWGRTADRADVLLPLLWIVTCATLEYGSESQLRYGFNTLMLLSVLWIALYGDKIRLYIVMTAMTVAMFAPKWVTNTLTSDAAKDAGLWLVVAMFVAIIVRQGVAASSTDPLTGIGNRRAMEESLVAEMQRATRFNHELAIAMVDIDFFKKFNDSQGHQAGDRLLIRAAKQWRKSLRTTDTIFRYGGEEFLVVLPGASAVTAIRAMERLRLATPQRQTASVGVAAWDGVESAAQLIQRADQALYQAKQAGRNRTTISPTPIVDLRVKSRGESTGKPIKNV